MLITDATVTFKLEGEIYSQTNNAWKGRYCAPVGHADITIEKEGFETQVVAVSGSRDDDPTTGVCLSAFDGTDLADQLSGENAEPTR